MNALSVALSSYSGCYYRGGGSSSCESVVAVVVVTANTAAIFIQTFTFYSICSSVAALQKNLTH